MTPFTAVVDDARYGVPAVWLFSKGGLKIDALRGEFYEQPATSRYFLGVDLGAIATQFLDLAAEHGTGTALRQCRHQWLSQRQSHSITIW
ncbi:hypothetical protein [Trichothermofontia sp.]